MALLFGLYQQISHRATPCMPGTVCAQIEPSNPDFIAFGALK
jgi:hypothetical protein